MKITRFKKKNDTLEVWNSGDNKILQIIYRPPQSTEIATSIVLGPQQTKRLIKALGGK